MMQGIGNDFRLYPHVKHTNLLIFILDRSYGVILKMLHWPIPKQRNPTEMEENKVSILLV